MSSVGARGEDRAAGGSALARARLRQSHFDRGGAYPMAEPSSSLAGSASAASKAASAAAATVR